MKDNAIESAIDSIIKTNGYRGTKAELYYFFHWLRKKHALRAYLTNLSSNRIPNAYFPEFIHSTVYKILRKSMIYVYFISCFDEPLLFRLLLQRSSTVGFSTSVNSVVRLPTNILFPSINMLIAAFKSLS